MDLVIPATSLLALVLYLNTLDADFAYDDSRAVQTNPDLEPKTPLINIFYDDFWGTPLTHSGSHKSYRPLCVLTFRLNYYLGELNPFGYHLGNVILHALVTGIFTKLSRIILKQTFPTLVSGLLFASHPVHTEAVAGVVGRADIGACLFFILALMNYMKYVKLRDTSHDSSASTSRFVYFLGTALLTTASMLTKEQGVTVLGVCAAFDLFVHSRIKLNRIFERKEKLEGVFLLGIVGIVLVAFRVYFMGNKPPDFSSSDNPASDSDSLITRTLTYLLYPALNVWMLICPRILSFDWSMSSIPLVETVWDPRNIFTLVFYSIIIYLAILTLTFTQTYSSAVDKHLMNGNGHSSLVSSAKHSTNKHKSHQIQRQTSFSSSTNNNNNVSKFTNFHSVSQTASSHSMDVLIFSIVLLVLPFIPATNLFFYVGFVIAERVLYIPSMGMCLIVAHGCFKLYKYYSMNKSGKERMVTIAIMIVIAVYGGKTMRRNRDWVSEQKLYESGIAVNPPKAWGNLANIYNREGRIQDAEMAYRNALKYRSNMGDTHYNLGILLQNQKRDLEAMESYRKAIACRPNLSLAHLNLAILLAERGNDTVAEQEYRTCADLDTSKLKDPRLHESTKISCLYNLGRLYSKLKRNEDAIAVFEEALRRRPEYYSPQSLYNMYGEVLSTVGRTEEGIHWFNEALKVKPDHIPAHLTMAKVLQTLGKHQEAESWYLKASKIDSEDVSIYQHYAQFLGEIGRLKDAATIYRSVLDKEPDNFELNFNAANIFRQLEENDLAEKLFKKVSLLKPSEAAAHMNLGAMYHLNGKFKEAEKSYLRALELKPEDKMTKENLNKLRNLKSRG
ncbi:Protein O-mannosyl-transferase tmtc2 [Mactra antiquata]